MGPLFAALGSPSKLKGSQGRARGTTLEQTSSNKESSHGTQQASPNSSGNHAFPLLKKSRSVIFPSAQTFESNAADLRKTSQKNSDLENNRAGIPLGGQVQWPVTTTNSQSPVYSPPTSPNHPPRTRSLSAMALAHASLGLSLAPVTPQASTSQSAIASQITRNVTRTKLRRAKSFAREEQPMSLVNGELPIEKSPPSQTRANANAITPPAGEQQVRRRPSKEPVVLAKRASFWSRKRVDSVKVPSSSIPIPAPPTPPPKLLEPSLPPVRPFTPLEFPPDPIAPSPTSTISTARSIGKPRSTKSHRSSVSSLLGLGGNNNSSTLLRERPASSSLLDLFESPVQSPTSPSHRSRSFSISAAQLTTSPLPSPDGQGFSSSLSRLPRPRSKTNPPLLRRLSSSFFLKIPSSNTSPTLPLEPPSQPPDLSPRIPVSKQPVPQPNDEETPEMYVVRLVEAVSKADVASILASKSEVFYVRALKAYTERFNFRQDPLDVALRKLLMDMGLPRETQQIDRVMEAFAAQYLICNPGLFASDDHPYILAFSLMMLHTDAFNRSNRHKMTKADYIKNTRLPGLAPEILDYFFDNIVFAPFIFIEDSSDVHKQESPSNNLGMLHATLPPATASSSSLLVRSNKIDPYFLITQNQLQPLRVDVDSYMPPSDHFTYFGTTQDWDGEELRQAFVMAEAIGVTSPDPWRRRQSMPFAQPPALQYRTSSDEGDLENAMTVKIAKMGVISRKEDLLEGGRRASNRRWRPWSMALTRSQLLFFRDLNWCQTFGNDPSSYGQPMDVHPDEVLPLDDSIAVFDSSYAKYPNTFRFILPHGRQFLMQTTDEADLNQWISRINYASAFKTAGVRMRLMTMSAKDAELTGIAAATSHIRDQDRLQQSYIAPILRKWNSRGPSSQSDDDLPSSSSSSAAPLSTSTSTSLMSNPPRSLRKPRSGEKYVETELPALPEQESADQLKATFDEVKASLASTLTSPKNSLEDVLGHPLQPHPEPRNFVLPPPIQVDTDLSQYPTIDPGPLYAARRDLIRSKIRDLDSKIATTQLRLDTDLRFVRNLAVLTPFQQSTRNRVRAAVEQAARRVRQIRMEMAKLNCHREILANDSAAEEREWHETKREALRAATEILKNTRQPVIPLTIDITQTKTSSVPAPQTATSRQSTSTSSFHSAREVMDEWQSIFSSPPQTAMYSALLSPLSTNNPSPMNKEDHLLLPSDYDISTTPSSQHSEDILVPNEPKPSGNQMPLQDVGVELEQEQAEDWNKTRAAKRVSLVLVPAEVARFSATLRPVRSDGELKRQSRVLEDQEEFVDGMREDQAGIIVNGHKVKRAASEITP